ncbi:MAG: endonuclease [Muribaculaceae bacterium]|nr:endonuclease [Muribaculaceae bacterium]
MKKTITLILTLLFCVSAWSDAPSGYYTNALGKHDEALMTALEGIIFTHSKLSYNYMWTAYDSTDVGTDGYYIDMYSNCKYDHSSAHVSGASYVGEGINREHSFPKSWFGGEVDPMFTDLTMLIPTDAFVNQRRSNYPYGVCAGGVTYTNDALGVTMKGKLGTSTYNGYTSTVFEPDDEYKGDFARIYFYMVTCYKDSVSHWPGSGQLDYATNNYKAFSTWALQLLLEWHRADPVSQKEISRNEAVYRLQGNRNPYVDHPELAEYIWGNKQNTNWTGQPGPDDPLEKEVPVMQPVDTTSVTGNSFRADWTAVDNVSSYTLNVNRIAVPGDETATLLMTENFSKVVATSDGNTDISGRLDDFTDNPGWTGYKLFQAAGNSLKVGTSTAIGYLVSPELELGNTVTVVFNAKNWIGTYGSDGSSVIVSCGNVSQTVTLTDTPADYTVVLSGCTADNIKLEMTAAKKRFYVYNVSIYNGDLTAKSNGPRRVVEEGDSTWRNVSGITANNYTVQALAGGVYEYVVKAVYTDGTESVWSNIQHVTITGNGVDTLIGDVNGDGEVNIGDVTTLIDYLLGNEGDDFVLDAADLDNDGEVNISDVTSLIDLLLGQ